MRKDDQPDRRSAVAEADPGEGPPLRQQHEAEGSAQTQQHQGHFALMLRAGCVVHRRVQRLGVVAERKDDRHREGCARIDLVEQTHEVGRARRHLRDAHGVAAALHHGREKHLRDGQHHGADPDEGQGSVDPRRAVEGTRSGARHHRVFGPGGDREDESFCGHTRVLEPVSGAADESAQGPGLLVVGEGAHRSAQQEDHQVRGGQGGEQRLHLGAFPVPEVTHENQQHQQIPNGPGHADPDQDDGHGGPGVLPLEELNSPNKIKKGDVCSALDIHHSKLRLRGGRKVRQQAGTVLLLLRPLKQNPIQEELSGAARC